MRVWFRFGVLLLPIGLELACGSSDVASPFTPSFPKGTGGRREEPSGGQAGALSAGGSAGESSGGAAGQVQSESGGSAGNPETGGSPATDCKARPPEHGLSTACGPDLSLGTSEVAPLDAGAAALLSATPDQKVLLGRGASPLGDYYFLAEREDAASDFGPTTNLDLPGYPVAVSPNGLRLILASEDRTELAEIHRTTIGEPFAGVPDPSAFALINDDVDENAHVFIGAVLTQDDLGLVYVTFDPDANGSRMHWAARAADSESFSAGEQLKGCELEGIESQLILPVSFASDGLGLFLYDELLGRARVAYRKNLSSEFKAFIDLEEDARIFVDADCGSVLLGAPFGNAPIQIAPIESKP